MRHELHTQITIDAPSEIVWDILTSCLEAAKVLGKDDRFTKRAAATLAKLDGPKIGTDGRLLEWAEELPEPEPGHRHVSHLYAVHPGRQITLRGTPKLAAAARKSLEHPAPCWRRPVRRHAAQQNA